MSLFARQQVCTVPTGGYIDGTWQEDTTADITFRGTIQTLSGKDIESLPVGREDSGKVKIYSDKRLPVSTEGADTTGGTIDFSGGKYELIMEMTYNNGLLPHYKYIAQYIGAANE